MTTPDLHDDARAWTEREFGRALPHEQALGLLKAIKVIAAADGLSERELEALRARMAELGVPESVRDTIDAFDHSRATLEQCLPELPHDRQVAKYLIISAMAVAQIDGYSERERDAMTELGLRLGLTHEQIRALEASEALGMQVRQRDDDDLRAAWQRLRHAVLGL